MTIEIFSWSNLHERNVLDLKINCRSLLVRIEQCTYQAIAPGKICKTCVIRGIHYFRSKCRLCVLLKSI